MFTPVRIGVHDAIIVFTIKNIWCSRSRIIAVHFADNTQQARSEQFDLLQLYEFDSDALWHFHPITITKHTVYAAEKRLTALPGKSVNIAITPRQQHIIAAWLDGSAVRFRNLTTGTDLPVQVSAEQMMMSEGHIYLKAGTSLLKLSSAN